MSTGKHTPGPWREHSVELYIVCGANGQAVADTEADGIGQNERFANARLIAAAPDLLEELREARDSILGWAAYASEYFKDKHDLDGDIARIDAVIAKATGEA